MKETEIKNLRLAQTCFSDSWGGLEMSTLKWTRYFQSLGIFSPCFCKQGSPLHQHVEQEKLHHVPFAVALKYWSPGLKSRLARICHDEKIDVLISHRSTDLWHIVPVFFVRPQSQVILVSRILSSTVKKRDLFHRRIYRKLAVAIVLSKLGKEYFLRMTGMDPKKVHVIPNGIVMEKYIEARQNRAEFRAELGLKDHEIAVALVGRIDPLKGHLEFIQALASVKEKYPNVRALIVGEKTIGEWDDYYARLEKTIEQHELQQHVRFLGFRNDVEKIYASADIFIMPSYAEAFGNVLLEAMASGLPVIATNTGAPPEILANGKYGMLIAPQSAEAIGQALVDLIRNSAKRAELGELGFQRVKEKYQLKIVMDQVTDLCFGIK